MQIVVRNTVAAAAADVRKTVLAAVGLRGMSDAYNAHLRRTFWKFVFTARHVGKEKPISANDGRAPKSHRSMATATAVAARSV